MEIRNKAELIASGDREGRRLALEILEGGLRAGDPYANTRALIRIEGDRLLIGGQPAMDVSGYGDETIDLTAIQKIYVIGAGKAVQRQAAALEDILGDRLTAGAITVKGGEGSYLKKIEVTEAAHPIPDEHSVVGARKIVDLAKSATDDDLVITLFSDGASSLFVLPSPGLGLEDVRRVFRLAIKYGSQRLIHEVMPYYSAVNCGRILRLAQPARTINLIVQVGRYPRWNGRIPTEGMWVPSWPPPPRRMAAAVKDIITRPWWPELPPMLRAVLGQVDPRYEVPALEEFTNMRASFWQPIDPVQMVEGARSTAESLGMRGIVLSNDLHALSSAASTVLAHLAHQIEESGHPFEPPVALITGGHLDVPTGGATGVGGRNQEFVLLWSQLLNEGRLASKNVVVAALDSDGTDGPGTQLAGGSGEFICMAGGVADGHTVDDAQKLGIDLAAELRNHNSTVALMKLNSAIYTGNTGACLGDLRVAIVRNRMTREGA